MKTNRTIKKLLIFCFLTIGLLFIPVGGAQAADQNRISSKAIFEGVWQCLQGGAIRSEFMASKPTDFLLNKLNSDTVKLPFGWTDVADNNLYCNELFFGYGNSTSGIKSGLIPRNIRDGSSNITEVAKFFAGDQLNGNGGAGFSAEPIQPATTGSGQKVSFTMRTDATSARACGAGNVVSPQLSLNGTTVGSIVFPTLIKNADGGVVASTTDSYNVPTPGSGARTRFDTTCNVPIDVEDSASSNHVAYTVYIDGEYYAMIQAKDNTEQAEWDGNMNWRYLNAQNYGVYLTGAVENSSSSGSSNFVSDYKLTWKGNGAGLLTGLSRKNTTGYSLSSNAVLYDDLALSKQEVFDLYKHYVKDVFGANVACEGDSNYEAYENAGLQTIVWSKCGTCRVDVDSATNPYPGNVYGVNNSGYHFTETVDSVQAAVDTLNSLGNIDDLTTNESCEDPTPSGGGGSIDNTSSSAEGIVDCNQINNVGAMQWILCPSMNNMQYTTNWLEGLVDSELEINKNSYAKDGASGQDVYKVWEYIRNIANVLMIIFLLVIIFSQLTGYGIDNYGIKKMLPRLIMMAIVVNLSYYICAVAIDLSNILGVGLRNMFGGIGSAVGDPTGSGLSFTGGMIVGAFGIGSAAGSGASIGAALSALALPAAIPIVIGVIVALLVILIAILTLFACLGIRRIIVIACLILSPAAFAAYILPNTQSIFKNWWNLFKVALIVFPICGLFSGISYVLKSTVGSVDALGIAGSFIMMVLPYAVFFLIPALIKSALSALGRIGGAVSSLGGSIRSGAQSWGKAIGGVAKNTETYKGLEKEGLRRRQERITDKTIEKLEALKAQQGGQFTGRNAERNERRLLEAHQTKDKMRMEQAMAHEGAVDIPPETMATRAQSIREAQELKNYSDQYAGISSAQMVTELTDAENAYRTERNDTNATRYRAALASAQSKGLNSNVLSSLNAVGLSDNDTNDQKILNSVDYDNLYSKLTRSELNTELGNAVGAYNASRSESNTRRLQSIIKAADGRGMDQEMQEHLGGLNMQANEANGDVRNDARVLDTMAGVNNKVLKQFGIQMGKTTNARQNMTMDQFADSTGPVKLSEALAGKGPDYLNNDNTSDDVLKYVAEHSIKIEDDGTTTYNPVISPEALANITANTSDEKKLRVVRDMYTKMDADDIKFTGQQLANFDLNTLQTIASRIRKDSQLQGNFVSAINSIANDPNLSANLSQTQKTMFETISRAAGQPVSFSGAQARPIVQEQGQEFVVDRTGGLSAQKLADWNTDDLKIWASNVYPGSQEYEQFWNMTEGIANNPALYNNLSADKKAIFSEVRRRKEPTDTKFGGPNGNP